MELPLLKAQRGVRHPKTALEQRWRQNANHTDFLALITEGNESQNIRLFDGDTVFVARSPTELREQIIQAGQTNLSPDFIQVYVTGRVREPASRCCLKGRLWIRL